MGERIIQPPSSVKRKYALCFSVLGHVIKVYKSIRSKTVERVLEKALLLAGGISEENFGNIRRFHGQEQHGQTKECALSVLCYETKLSPWTRRGISKGYNTFLPDDIHIHYIQKVAKTFNSKFCCSGRKYHYILPTYLLFEETIITKFMNEAQEGKEGEDGKTLFAK